MTLYFYFARKFLKFFAAVFSIFFVILFLLDTIEQLRKFDGTGIGFSEIAHLSLLSVPASAYRILPLITILATLAMFLNLARSSELVVTRASGRSGLKTLVAPVLMALLIGLVSVSILNPIVAGTTKRYESISNGYLNGRASILSVSTEGLWLRQGGENGQTVINAAGSNLDGTKLKQVSFYSFSPRGDIIERIEANSAQLVIGAWILKDAIIWNLQNDNPEQNKKHLAELRIESQMTRDQIRDSFGTPSTIPIWELPSFIAQLDHAGFSALRHRVWLHMEITLPVMLVAMVLLGSALTMRHTRAGGTGLVLLISVLMGFSLYFIRNFAQVLGENNQIPVILAAWAPPVAAILIALTLLLHLEDG